MNRKTIASAFVLAVLASSASAQTGFAGDISIDLTPFTSAQSRAEVRAELDAYRASGVNPWSRSYNPHRNFASSSTRAQVTSDYLANRDTVAAIHGEDSGSAHLAATRARADRAIQLANQQGGRPQQ